MKKLDKPYSGPNAIYPEFYRDSRHAFGSRFQADVDDKKIAWAEWAFCLIGIACGIASIILMAGQA